jgi:ribosome maturation factor RimP
MGSILDTLKDKIKPLVEEEDLELVELEFFGGGPRSVLRIYVDKTAGVTVDQCADLNRKIGDYLDMENLIPHRYLLEVSSPGLDRPLFKKADFKRKIGEKVKVFLKEKIEEQAEWVGKIKSLEDENLILMIEPRKSEFKGETEKVIPLNKIAWAKIMY